MFNELPAPGADSALAMIDPMADGEYLAPEDEEPVYEPPPRPIDWRVRKFWDNAEERRKLGRWLAEEIERYYEAVRWRLDNLKIWRDDYEIMPWDGPQPYSGAATLRAPFTSSTCDGHALRLNAQIVQQERPVIVEPMDAEAVNAAPEIEDMFAGRLEEAEWPLHATALHTDLPIAGNAFLRVQYERKTKRVPALQVDFDMATFEGLRLAGADLLTAQQGAIKRDKRGAIKFSMGWNEVVTYTGTAFKMIPFEDGFFFPITCRDTKDARAIGERLILTGMDLDQGAKEGLYIEEEVEDLLKRRSDDIKEDRQDRLDHSGIEVTDADGPMARHDPRYREYSCHRFSLRFDGNEDGLEEILLVTLHCETKRILDIRYSQYEHGEHIYHHFPFKRRAGEALGFGVAEKIAVYQDAESARLNQEANHGDLVINAATSLIADDSSGLDADTFEFTPGRIIRVRDARGVKEFPLQPLPPEHALLGQRYKDNVDLVAGTSNPSLGKATDTDRTAREVTIVASNANMIFEGVAEEVALHWSRVWEQMRSIEAQFNEGGQVKYRKNAAARAMATTGEEMFGAIDAEMLLAKVKLVPAGLRELSDMQSRMSQAMAMNNVFGTNPLTAQNPMVWRIALRTTMEAAKYAPKDEVMAEVDKTLFATQIVDTAESAAMLQAGAPAPGADQGALPPTGVTDGAPVPEAGGPGPGVMTGAIS